MTRSSAIWATDIEANDLRDNKQTSSRAKTSLPFDDMRDNGDDDDKEEDFFDAEAGWYVPVSIFMHPPIYYLRTLKLILYDTVLETKGSWIW
eukprot:scaffold47790_cov30-Attheya_sp.AAC.1